MCNKILFIGKQKDYLIDFILLNKEIKVINYHSEFQYFENLFVFFSYDVHEPEVSEEIKKINSLNFTNYIFLPTHLKKLKINKIHEVLFYPTDIKKFEFFLNKNQKNNCFFGDICIENSFLVNQKNKLKVYLTETQNNILRLLMIDVVVKKNKLKNDVLNFNDILDTKSLESHLSRLRKKLLEIESKVLIISFNNDCIKLVANGVSH